MTEPAAPRRIQFAVDLFDDHPLTQPVDHAVSQPVDHTAAAA